MKISKLFTSSLIGCVLLGASGAAMAQQNDCDGGIPPGETLDELIISGIFTNCDVLGVTVKGDVRVIGADGFTMRGSLVKGDVTVEAAASQLQGNTFEGKVSVKREPAFTTMATTVINNLVDGSGNLVINDGVTCDPVTNSTGAYVAGNHFIGGSLKVQCLKTAIVVGNTVANGDLICSDNLNLNRSANVVLGGKDKCNRDLPNYPPEPTQ